MSAALLMYLLLFVPEVLIAVLALLAFGISLYAYHEFHDFPAFGYLFPLAYVFAVYLWFVFANPDEITRRVLARFGLIGFMIDIVVWRINFISEKRKNGR